LRRLGIGVWGATIGAAPILLDAYRMNIEQFIMAETLFGALLVGAIVLIVWPKRPGLVACAAAGALLAGATLTREVGIVLIVPVLLYLLGRRAGVLRTGAAAVAFV